MIFQSYLFSKNCRKIAIDIGAILKINISNIPDKILNDKFQLCKFLSSYNIVFSKKKNSEALSEIFEIQYDKIMDFIENHDYDISIINERLQDNIKNNDKCLNLFNLNCNNTKFEMCDFFYKYNGVKSVFLKQVYTKFEKIHCKIRLKSLFYDTLLMYIESYIRALKILNQKSSEVFNKNTNKIKKLSYLLKTLDNVFEYEKKQIMQACNTTNSIYENIHISGFKYTSDIYNGNKYSITNIIKYTVSMLVIIILIFIMFIISAIMSCFALFNIKNNFLNSKLIQTSIKIKQALMNMS